MDACTINEVFDHEIDTLYLNFSDPWPKERHEKRRRNPLYRNYAFFISLISMILLYRCCIITIISPFIVRRSMYKSGTERRKYQVVSFLEQMLILP